MRYFLIVFLFGSLFANGLFACPQLNLETSIVHEESCGRWGKSVASVTVTPNAGTAPFTFLWDDYFKQTTATATGLPIGKATVIVLDANGCIDSISVYIKDKIQISIDADKHPCLTCSDGEVTATVTGSGEPPYSYRWNDENEQTTATASGLNPGEYIVVVSDWWGCYNTDTVSIGVTCSGLDIETSVERGVGCDRFGKTRASLSAVPTSGTPPYTYLWDDNNKQTSAELTWMLAGTYKVTVTDANGCEGSKTVIVEPKISLSINVDKEPCSGCSDGVLTVSMSGFGNLPYTFRWNDNVEQTTATATGLTPGEYIVVVTDAYGCYEEDTVLIGIPQGSCEGLEIETSIESSNGCDRFGKIYSRITAVPTSGVPPYTYLWDDYLKQTTAEAVGMLSGTYKVIVTDATGCEGSTTVVVEPKFYIGISIDNNPCSACSDGKITATASGNGELPYSYLWNDEDEQRTATATELPPGEYVVIITDAEGCWERDTVLIGVPGCEALDIETTLEYDGGCDRLGGSYASVTVIPTSGNPPFSYAWNDANKQTTATARVWAHTTYEVVVTDSTGCQDSIIIKPGGKIQIDFNIENEPCSGCLDGVVTATISGFGEAPYGFRWNDENEQTTATASGLASGEYVLVVWDNQGCVGYDTVSIGITSIYGWKDDNSLQIFPNPTTDRCGPR